MTLLSAEHEHIWNEAAVHHQPGMVCDCGMFTEITKREFKARFGRAFWRFLKEHDDKFLFRGYMQNKRERERWGR